MILSMMQDSSRKIFSPIYYIVQECKYDVILSQENEFEQRKIKEQKIYLFCRDEEVFFLLSRLS